MKKNEGKVDHRVDCLKSILNLETGLIGTENRWWTGNAVFDFNNLSAEEGNSIKLEESESEVYMKERNQRLLEELLSPLHYPGRAASDIEAVERGLNFILNLALDEDNFKTFGSDAFLTFYDVATTAEEPLRKFALLRTEIAAAMWLKNYPLFYQNSQNNDIENNDNDETSQPLKRIKTDSDNEKDSGSGSILANDPEFDESSIVVKSQPPSNKKAKDGRGLGTAEEDPTAEEVLDFVMGIYALERVGISHHSKEEVRKVATRYDLQDFFGVRPDYFRRVAQGGLTRIDWRDFTQVLTYSFYAEKTGIDIHISTASVLATLPLYRPYKRHKLGPKDKDEPIFDDFADQLTMIFNVIHVLSNYGELRLSPGLLPQETKFLSEDGRILDLCLGFRDVHLVGEVVHCLRVLGFTADESPVVTRGLEFLRGMQGQDGGWPARDDSDDPYFKYHATMCAISALNPQRFRGFGPSNPSLYPLLQRDALKCKDTGHAVRVADFEGLGVNNFINSPLPPLSTFAHIERLYMCKSRALAVDTLPSVEEYGAQRVQALIDYKLQYSTNKSDLKKGEHGRFKLAGQRSVSGSGGGKRRKKKETEDEGEWKPSTSG